MIWTNPSQLTMLAAIIAVINGDKVHLYDLDHTPTPESVLADFHEASFVGYASYTVTTWGTAYLSVDGMATTTAPSHQWTGPAAGAGPTIFGYYITDSAGLILRGAARFVTPIPLLDATQSMILEINLDSLLSGDEAVQN
jgi:hypothetical protein